MLKYKYSFQLCSIVQLFLSQNPSQNLLIYFNKILPIIPKQNNSSIQKLNLMKKVLEVKKVQIQKHKKLV